MWYLKSQQGRQKNCSPEFLILSALKLPRCGLVVFVDMNTYILTEGTNFKTFLKEKYPIALTVVSYIFTKKMLSMDLNMILSDLWSLHILDILRHY